GAGRQDHRRSWRRHRQRKPPLPHPLSHPAAGSQRSRAAAIRKGPGPMSDVVLLADDDSAIRMVLNQALTRAGYEGRPTGNLSTMWNWVSRGKGDILITDVAMPDGNAFEIMPKIRKLRAEMPIIVMSAQNTFMTAIRANELGAYEYLPKPFDITEVLSVVGRALADAKKPAASTRKPESPEESMPLVGRSAAKQDIYRALARLMQTDLTVMITGESGTGKELVARALHDFGKRRNGPFVAINMAAIPRDLTEAEPFGHEKGAFTGANPRSSGPVEPAGGGGRNAIKTNVRIVAATHRDLSQMIRQGLFREDLYYRLNVVPIRLPPLRERVDDVADLAQHFLRAAQREGEPVKTLTPEAIRLMQNYSWPGNVRELENLVRRLSALYADESISAEIVQNELNISDRPQMAAGNGPIDISTAIESHVAQLLRESEPNLPPSGLYQRV